MPARQHDSIVTSNAVMESVLRDEDDDTDTSEQSTSGELQNDSGTNTSMSNVPSLVCAFAASATTGGTTYAFGLYGAALKKSLHLSQSELDSISTAFFVAGLFSWIPGIFSDRFGTRLALTTGGISAAISLLSYWCVARQFVFVPHQSLVAVLSTFGITTFLSCALVTGAVFKIIVAATGPGTKGRAVGAAKGYVGLGAGLYACIFEAIRLKRTLTSDLDFLPMAAFFAVFCCSIPSFCFLPKPQTVSARAFREDIGPNHMRVLYVSIVTLALLVVGNSMWNLYQSSSNNHTHSNNTTTMVDNTTYAVLFTELQIASPPSKQGPRYWLALLYVLVWQGPIFSLWWLPRQSYQQSSYDNLPLSLPGEEGDEPSSADNEENASGNGLEMEPPTRPVVVRRRSSERTDVRMINNSERSSSEKSGSERSRSERLSRSPRRISIVDEGEEECGLLFEDDTAKNKRGWDEESIHNLEANITRDQSHCIEVNNTTTEEPNYNLIQMLQTPSAILLLWTTTILVGAGTVMTNGLGQMVEALGFSSDVTPASLALFSVAQATARVATGSLSESAMEWNINNKRFRYFCCCCCCIDKGIPRPFFLVVASVLGFLAHFILGLARTQIVFVGGVAISGAAFGMVWPLMVLITGEWYVENKPWQMACNSFSLYCPHYFLFVVVVVVAFSFGVAHVGGNYMFYDGFASAAGTLLLTKFIAQNVYEANIHANHSADANTCIGMTCFQATHMVVAGLSLTCVVTSLGLLYTSRQTYNRYSLHIH
jgi:MFS family permease